MLDAKRVQERLADLAGAFKAYIDLTKKDRSKVTRADKKRMADLEAELTLILEPQERSDFLTDVNGVARFFKVTIRAVQYWVRLQGCPKLRHGLYDLGAVFVWWLENINSGSDSAETESIKREYWKWKAENEKMKAKQTQESLIPAEEIEEMWASRMAEVSSGLQALSMRLPPLVEGKTQIEMQAILEEEIWKLKDSYCRTGRFCEC